MPRHKTWLSYSELFAEFKKRLATTEVAESFLLYALEFHMITIRIQEYKPRPSLEKDFKHAEVYDHDNMYIKNYGVEFMSFNHEKTHLFNGTIALTTKWDSHVGTVTGAEYDWRDLDKIFGRKGIGGAAIKSDSWSRLTQLLFKIALDDQFQNFTSYSQFKKEVCEGLNDKGDNLHPTSIDRDLKQIWESFSER